MNRFVKLKDICLRITDGSHYSPKAVDVGYPMLSVKNMRYSDFDYQDCKFISEKDYFLLVNMDCKPLKNDVVIAKDGSYLKHVFVIKGEKEQAVLSSIGILRPNVEKINPFYLKYYLHTSSVKEIVAKKYVSGSALPRIILKNFGEIDILYKSLPIQQRIASVLSCLDDKIELNNRINAELEAMAKTLYDYWFIQFDFPDTNGKPYKSSGGKMVYNEKLKREIPEGWEVDILDNYIDKIIDYRGKTPKKLNYDWSDKSDDIIALSAKHVKGGKLVNLTDANRVDEELYNIWMNEKLKEGDILMTSEAPCGEFFYLIGKTNFCLSQRLFAIRANNSIIKSSYLYYELSQGHGLSQILGKISGSTVFGIRQDELRKVNVLKPSISLQQMFDEISINIYRKIRNNDYNNQQLSSLRDNLLPMLMNGQVGFKGEYQEQAQAVSVAAEAEVEYKRTAKNDNFYKIQNVYAVLYANKLINVQQGEMALAKDMYLVDRIAQVNTGFSYAQHNWGSFDPAFKKTINNTQYFAKCYFPNSKAYYCDTADDGYLLAKIPNELKAKAKATIAELHNKIFKNYFGTKKAEMKELYATVLKCIEDTQSTDFAIIRQAMKNWETPKQSFPNKAAKFSEQQTKGALSVIIKEGWDKKVLNRMEG